MPNKEQEAAAVAEADHPKASSSDTFRVAATLGTAFIY